MNSCWAGPMGSNKLCTYAYQTALDISGRGVEDQPVTPPRIQPVRDQILFSSLPGPIRDDSILSLQCGEDQRNERTAVHPHLVAVVATCSGKAKGNQNQHSGKSADNRPRNKGTGETASHKTLTLVAWNGRRRNRLTIHCNGSDISMPAAHSCSCLLLTIKGPTCPSGCLLACPAAARQTPSRSPLGRKLLD